MKRLKKIAVMLMAVLTFALTITGCVKNDAGNENISKEVKHDISAAALKGPTGIGLVKIMEDNQNNTAKNNYTFNVAASADVFTADLLKNEVQIAALPCNAAATLYNKSNGKVRILGVNTLGVLYIMDTGSSVNSVADLKGKKIYTTGKGTTPEYTLRHLLKAAGIDPDKEVTIEFKSEAAEVAAIMAQSSEEIIAMLPQPYVTTVQMNNSKARTALDVTAEWEKLEGNDSTVVTGVIVVNAEYYKNNKSAVEQFMREYKASAEYVNSNVDAAAKLVEKFGIFKEEVARKAIPECNITCVTGEDMKTKVSNYLKVLYDENPAAIGGKMPEADFYIAE
ncbi:MAG: ABC transporter substrate-binding protein [Eubacteriales bacterium]|nr:ABC transporter substrate-binding protein [Eubacteriales bacterium]